MHSRSLHSSPHRTSLPSVYSPQSRHPSPPKESPAQLPSTTMIIAKEEGEKIKTCCYTILMFKYRGYIKTDQLKIWPRTHTCNSFGPFDFSDHIPLKRYQNHHSLLPFTFLYTPTSRYCLHFQKPVSTLCLCWKQLPTALYNTLYRALESAPTSITSSLFWIS